MVPFQKQGELKLSIHHTFTFQSLLYKAKEHRATKVAKCWRPVGVDCEQVWTNDGLILWNFCFKNKFVEKLNTTHWTYILGILYSSMFDGLEGWGWGERGSLLFCLKMQGTYTKEMPMLN